MALSELEQYQKYIQARLRSISPVFAKAAIGDFSGTVPIPEKEDELTEFFVGVKIIMEAIREKIGELEATVGDLRAANDIIANEKARIEAILGSLGEGLVTIDRTHHITYANSVAAVLLCNEVLTLGQDALSFFTLEDQSGKHILAKDHPITQAITKARQVTVGLSTRKQYFLRRNHAVWRVGLKVTPIMIGGQLAGAAIVFRDITEESKLDQAKSEIISIASHQLRTPLTTVKWYVDELMDQVHTINPEKRQEYLGQIKESNQRMIQLVDHLLSVSRIDLGTLALHPAAIELVPTVHSVLKDLAAQIHDKQLDVVQKIEPRLPKVVIDPHSLHIVLQNLLSNAVKYSLAGRRIVFTAGVRAGAVLITVVDEGCGIPANQQAQVFTKLFRATNAQRFSSNGSGLGLYITRALVEQSKGKIWFTSAEGEGTTFYVIIPTEHS